MPKSNALHTRRAISRTRNIKRIMKEKNEPEVGVHLCGPYNSTMFTDCCGVAICNDEIKCPSCGRLVIGSDCKTDNERRIIRWRTAYNKM